VIGNDAYVSIRPLEVAVNDAKAISGTLKNLGFEVIYAENTNVQQMRAFLDQFANKARGSALALFYFAGHGAQYGNENFLIPTDFDFSKGLANSSLYASQVIEILEKADVPTRILILDACRNWKENWGSLAYMESPARFNYGTLIAFSTEPGTQAVDRLESTDANSPYARALLKYMPQSLPLEIMFDKVTKEVRTNTRGRLPKDLKGEWRNRLEQTPWIAKSLDGGSLCLAPCIEASASGDNDTSTCKAHVGQGIYDGECQNSIPHGQGTLRYSDGEYYQGNFSNGVRHGRGIQYLTDGTEVRGVWMNGRLQ
jgi:hypothetical protein